MDERCKWFLTNQIYSPGSAPDSGSSGFGAPSSFGNQGGAGLPPQGQSSFGAQPNNFGQTGGGSQC